MKKNVLFLFIFCSFLPVNLLGINYTISFTSSGRSNTLDSVKVINLTTGASIITTDSVLLSDEFDGIVPVTNDEGLKIIPTPNIGTYIVEFNSLNNGNCHFRILSTDGKIVSTSSKMIHSGMNRISFNAKSGVNIIHIFGAGYNYAAKIVNPNLQNSFVNKIDFLDSNGRSNSLAKIKAISISTLLFKEGDRILVKGYSGNYSNITVDIPTSNKTINFIQSECQDASGNYYSTVKIGSKTWMAENLKTTKYRTGDNILNLTSNSDWGFYGIGSYCVYNNSEANSLTYGLLYNWHAIKDTRNLAPEGWHVASDAEWTNLVSVLGGENVAGYKIKETSLLHWFTNENATNEYGFTGLPSGFRLTSGTYSGLGTNTNWWTSDENSSTYSWYRSINSSSNILSRDYYNKNAGYAIRCVKDPEQPILKTISPLKISYTTFTIGGIIVSDGGSTINSFGVCWSSNHNPTISDNKTSQTITKDTIFSVITGLNVNAKYYIRAYATTSSGTIYGNEVEAFTQDYDSIVTDIDGNAYHVITIGNQTWMVENLKTTKYRNGDLIGSTSSIYTDITYNVSPKYQWACNGVESNVPIYGRLYTWYATTDSRKIAPEGWHVPVNNEWTELENYLIANGYNYDGTKTDNKILKSLCSTTLWNYNSTNGSPANNMITNNSSAFTIYPAGYRGFSGNYYLLGDWFAFWTADEFSTSNAYTRYNGIGSISLNKRNDDKKFGFSVRCIKNTKPTIVTNSATSIKSASFRLNGTVVFDGGDGVTESGFCYANDKTPDINDNKTISNSLISSSFSADVDSLIPNTEYLVRAYSINKNGISYGDVIKVKTLLTDPEMVVDIDGNVYHTVTIGSQVWMVENLKTTRYRNRDLIGTTSSIYTDITYDVSPKYQWAYGGNENNVAVYGRLYTWYAATDNRNIAPEGWHIATNNEWTELENYLIENGYNYDKSLSGNKINTSIAANLLWNTSTIIGTPGYDLTQNNSSGFSIFPVGYRGFDGSYYNLGYTSDFWTSTEKSLNTSYMRVIGHNGSSLNTLDLNKNYGFSVRCLKNYLPVVTNSVNSILSTKATVSCSLISNGGDPTVELGVCWDTLPNPSKTGSVKKVTELNSKVELTELTPNTQYYVKAYATNSEGTVYGNEISFKTLETDPEMVVDIDGNVYTTVTIGSQVWMVENLKVTKYNDGSSLAFTTSGYDWLQQTTGAYCWPQDDSNYKNTYGAFYNWYAVSSGKLAPAGWHIPTENDWIALSSYLGGAFVAGGKLKEAGTNHWFSPNTGATNETGFTALPAGYRSKDNGSNPYMGEASVFWSSTGNFENYGRLSLDYSSPTFNYGMEYGNFGLNVRCIKN